MKVGDVVEVDRCCVQAGDPIPDMAWHDLDLLCCPSPNRRAQRMRPNSAGSYSGSCMSGLADVTLKRPPVPPILIPDPGVPVEDLYQQSDSESDEDDNDDDDEEEEKDDNDKASSLGQNLLLVRELDMLSRNPHQMSVKAAVETCGHKAATPQEVNVREPCGSSARPPRAKGSHSLEVRPAGPMQFNTLGHMHPSGLCG